MKDYQHILHLYIIVLLTEVNDSLEQTGACQILLFLQLNRKKTTCVQLRPLRSNDTLKTTEIWDRIRSQNSHNNGKYGDIMAKKNDTKCRNLGSTCLSYQLREDQYKSTQQNMQLWCTIDCICSMVSHFRTDRPTVVRRYAVTSRLNVAQGSEETGQRKCKGSVSEGILRNCFTEVQNVPKSETCQLS